MINNESNKRIEINYKFINFFAKDLIKLVSDWLEYLSFERQYSRYTVISYKTDLEYFIMWLSKHMDEKISTALLIKIVARDIRAWLTKRQQQNFSPSSSRRAIATIRSFFNYLRRYNNLDNNIISSIRSPRKAEILPKALAEEDSITAIEYIDQISNETWIGFRDKAVLSLMYGSGLRISEVLALTKQNINVEHLIIKGKGKKERIIPLLDVVRNNLKKYLDNCPYNITLNDKIFIGKQGKPLNPGVFQRQIRKVRTDLGLSDLTTPHAFRHSFASDLLTSGADLRSIQELLGHKNLSTTQRYTKIDHKRLFESYNLAHPRSGTSKK